MRINHGSIIVRRPRRITQRWPTCGPGHMQYRICDSDLGPHHGVFVINQSPGSHLEPIKRMISSHREIRVDSNQECSAQCVGNSFSSNFV